MMEIVKPRRIANVLGASIFDVRIGGGRGSPKSRRNEQDQLFSVNDRRGRGSKIPKFLRTSYMEVPVRKSMCLYSQLDHARIINCHKLTTWRGSSVKRLSKSSFRGAAGRSSCLSLLDC